MEHLSIGEFARTSGLTPKALRLYDELDLLRPDRVDPLTGYRWYAPAQLDRARLVARLRLIGMPLARIRAVASAPAGVAADQVRAYWRQVEADTASRRDIVASVVEHLRTKETIMQISGPTLTARSAWRLGQGARAAQQDALYAGGSLFVVADGFGPHGSPVPAGLAVDAFAAMDAPVGTTTGTTVDAPWTTADGDPAAALLAATAEASRAITAEAATLPDPHHFGTTVTAALLVGSTLFSAHVGDSRLWLVRDSRAERLTRDHTVVAALIEEGRLTEDEARSHEDRNLLNQALVPVGTGGHSDAGPDLATTEVRAGDRFVLTGDGVHAVLAADHLAALLTREGDPDAVGQEIACAVEAAGAPDNYALVVVDLDA
ncbi:MerR family transcriptional regulator [Promicromonospora sp. MEB111]|uniref:MerR family transcriptional regulator n=1 Tax=Promicromonospora sp. MEB111 TaxID=3040301 RepID=UPI00254DF3A0|nr:MerR family transcriptional regulator [Promicromonospora sp. MEB111]